MNLEETFKQFLATDAGHIDPLGFMLNLALTIFLTWVLSQSYIRFGLALTNRRRLAGSFVLLALTTMVIITIVKSSLALSLGLVGALSIVRFRSAIKEPEELVFLFICISIGLGLGANQILVTVLAFMSIIAVVYFRGRNQQRSQNQGLLLTVSFPDSAPSQIEAVIAILNKHAEYVKLKRLDEGPKKLEAVFAISFKETATFQACRKDLRSTFDLARINFLDDQILT